jgi:hypothetical protein
MTDGTIPGTIGSPEPAAYALTGLQGGMLYRYLAGGDPGDNLDQLLCTLEETIEPAALRAAWDAVAHRHGAMTTAIAWESSEEPVQRVTRLAEIPWHYEDLAGADEAAQSERISDYLAADRSRGFRLDQPPLTRLALFRLGPARFQLVWTLHHIILDGTSRGIILREVFEAYDAGCRGEPWCPPPAPRPFREFIEWLSGRDDSADAAFWKEFLKGFGTPTTLSGARSAQAIASGRRTMRLDAALAPGAGERLKALARDNGLTITNLIHGAWAVILSRHSGEPEVVFGVVRAGRPRALAGADSMVGMLINTLPLRISVPEDAELVPWLREVRERWRAMRDHEHTPLAGVQRVSELGAGPAKIENIGLEGAGAVSWRLPATGEGAAGR